MAGWEEKMEAYLGTLRRLLGHSDGMSGGELWAQGLDSLIAPRLPQPADHDPLVLRHPLSGEPLDPCSGTRSESNGDPPTLKDLRETAKVTLDQAVAELTTNVQDPKRRFLTLWRYLPEKTQELAQTEDMRRLWALLPGDPTIPDHTVWQRAATASAFAVALPRPALLLFTIASVQDFLKESRRTQDFWMGSFLVSYLMWAAMGPVVDKLGPDALLMPDLRGQPLVDRWLQETEKVSTQVSSPDSMRLLQTATLPNVFTAVVPAEDGESLAQQAEKAVHQTKNEIFGQVRAYVEEAVGMSESSQLVRQVNWDKDRPLDSKTRHWLQESLAHLSDDGDWGSIWERQAAHFLDFHLFWAALPWPEGGLGDVLDLYERHCQIEAESPVQLARELSGEGDDVWDGGGGYHLMSALAGRLLAARKELRHFPQVEEPGHKCSQCGLREALHPSWPAPISHGDNQRDTYAELRLFWESLRRVNPKAKKGKLTGRIRRGDRLCAVCLVKRLAWEAVFMERLGLEGLRQEMHVPFPSTATLAAAPFKGKALAAAVRDTAVREKLRCYVDAARGLLEEYNILLASRVPPLLEQNGQAAVQDGLEKNMVQTFLRLDGDWLYEESFAPERILREYGIEPEDRAQLQSLAQKSQEALRGLLKAVEGSAATPVDLGTEGQNESEAHVPGRPARYYAVLYLDADHMGEWVSGVKGPGYLETLHTSVVKEMRDPFGHAVLPTQTLARLSDRRFAKPLTPLRHKALAEALNSFALKTARRIAEERHYGMVLYSGGDDLRVLLPLEGLATLMDELERLFRGSPFDGGELTAGHGLVSLRGEFHLAAGAPWRDDEGVTVSAGICVAHQDYPLRLVMRETEEAEREAKEVHGRNAFSIHVLKRSGGAVSVGGPWRMGRQGHRVLEGLDQARDAFRSGLSPRILRQMQAEAAGMSAVPQECWEAEWSHLLASKERPPGAEQTLQGTIPLLMEGYAEWMSNPNREARAVQDDRSAGAWRWAADLLAVAGFLAREE